MEYTDIAFVSSRGRNMTPSLHLIRKYLSSQAGSPVSFRYFLKNERSAGELKKRGIQIAKQDFCAQAPNIICEDASLSGKMDFPENGRRLMLFSLYDYAFETYLKYIQPGNRGLRPTFRNFTHIMTFSPAAASILKNGYEIESLKVLAPALSPLAFEITQSRMETETRRELLRYFPEIAGKKILTVLTKKEKKDEPSFFESFDLRAFLSALGEGIFLFTNCPELVERAETLPGSFRGSAATINRTVPGYRFLSCTDILVTNIGQYAEAFAARRRPVYSFGYVGNFFEQYMQLCYAPLHLQDGDALQLIAEEGFPFTEDHRRFCGGFSYPAAAGAPYEEIRKVFFPGSAPA